MTGRLVVMLWVGVATLAMVGCSPGSGSGSPGSDVGSGDGGTVETGDTGSDVQAGPYVGPGSQARLDGLPRACATTDDCAQGVCRSGVCVADPPAQSISYLTDSSNDKLTTDPPDLSCVGIPTAAPDGPATVTLYGAVARFGSGRETVGIHVDVFLAEGFDPAACEGKSSQKDKDTCYATYGTAGPDGHGPLPIGQADSTAVGDLPVPDTCTGHWDCPLGYQCIEQGPDHVCEVSFGLYEIADMPTNTPLVVRSRATEYEDKWHDTYHFGVYLFADGAGAGGRYHYDVTMVSHGQWLLTTNAVGLSPIPLQNGAVGGRVRDCYLPGGRDSWAFSEASLALAEPAKGIVYFNDLEDDSVPLVDRATTNVHGRYAALDVVPGWNRIAGAARPGGGEAVTIGSLDFYVFPNSLTIASWPGLKPQWKQN